MELRARRKTRLGPKLSRRHAKCGLRAPDPLHTTPKQAPPALVNGSCTRSDWCDIVPVPVPISVSLRYLIESDASMPVPARQSRPSLCHGTPQQYSTSTRLKNQAHNSFEESSRHDEADASPLPLFPDNSPPSLPTYPSSRIPHFNPRRTRNDAPTHGHATHIPLPFHPRHNTRSSVTAPFSFSRCKRATTGLAHRTTQNAHEKIRVVRRRSLLCGIHRRLCRRVCGDQFARRRLRLLCSRICESLGARPRIFATAGARSGGDGRRFGECDPAGTRRIVCHARPRVHRAQDLVFACPDRIYRSFYAEDRELASRPGVGWWRGDTEGHGGDERTAEESRLSAFTTVCSILTRPMTTMTLQTSFISPL